MIQQHMKAIVAQGLGEVDVLKMVERPIPQPGPGEILLRVSAAGVNRPDVMQRRGIITVPAGVTDILGLEASGVVVGLGVGVDQFSIGQSVMALLSGGGYAQYAIATADHCFLVPFGMSMNEAAALPEGAFTVWHNLFILGRLQPGETLLIHGGASGIGTLATRLAKAIGAQVIVTVGSDEKQAFMRELGAVEAINYKTQDFVKICHEITDGVGVDVVLDIVGGDAVMRNLEAMAPGGRHVSLSFMQGSVVPIDLQILMKKQLMLTSSTMRPKSWAEKTRIAQDIQRYLLPLLRNAQVRPHIHAALRLDEAAQAHHFLESGANCGKVILLP